MEAIHVILGAPKTEAIQPLLKSKGLIMGIDRGALLAIEEGIDVDIALGDFDSITEHEKNIIHENTKKVVEDSSTEDTDTEVALLYILENYSKANIYLYNWYGGRVDHLYSILLVALQERFEGLVPRLRLVSEKNDISYRLPGEHSISKIEEMDYLSYILLTEVKDLTLKNVKYPLNEATFKRPLALISNEFLKDQAFFSFSAGLIAVIQSRD